MDILAQPVLVLNAGYVPIGIRSVKDALILIILEKAQLIKDDESLLIRSEKLKFTAPRIILLRDYFKVPPRKDRVSRENIFQRDNYHCVYCGKKFPSSKLTLDHVIPRSRWDGVPKKEKPKDFNSWENLVAACKHCNTRKGNKLLSELKWNLPEENRVTPKLRFPLFSISDQQAEKFGWREYISF